MDTIWAFQFQMEYSDGFHSWQFQLFIELEFGQIRVWITILSLFDPGFKTNLGKMKFWTGQCVYGLWIYVMHFMHKKKHTFGGKQ